jgi:molybdate transport system substrate-binding protein
MGIRKPKLVRKMKKIVLFITVPFLISASQIEENKITVAVAANAQYAMKQIEIEFEKETGKQVELIIGSSGKHTAQIKEGAPYDIFISADMEYPQTLFKDGVALAQPKIYAYGTLVLWTTKEIDLLNPNVLLLPEVKAIAIANPKLAPYGEAAVSAMKYYKLYEKVEAKLVYGENISQVNQYINSKTADIGFTAKSVVLSPEMIGKGKWVELNKKSYQPIAQGAVLLKGSLERNKEGSEQFYNYLYSEKAKKIFKKYGYVF